MNESRQDTYRSVVLPRKGPPEVLELVERPLRPPRPGEVRVRVSSCGVGFTDVIMRVGHYPYAPKKPFVPGYEVVGVVDAVGPGVDTLEVGQKVAALTVHGGYSEYLYREAEHFVPVPDGLDDAEVVSLVLNYVTAYQMLHRKARVREGDTILVTGAAGGVGSALLDLGRVAKLRVYGAASPAKHGIVEDLGGIPIDYHTQDFAEVIREQVPGGADAAFDGVGGESLKRCLAALKPGGALVSYGFTSKASSRFGTIAGIVSMLARSRLSSRRGTFYGITHEYRKDMRPFLEDLPKLLELLERGRIRPRIAQRLPFTEVARAHRLLEGGAVQGKLVLSCWSA